MEITPKANSQEFSLMLSLKFSKVITIENNNYFKYENDYLTLKNPITLTNFNPGEIKQVKIKENYIENVGATSGLSENATGYASIKFNPNGNQTLPTIIVSPEHVGDEFFSLILPMNPNINAFEGQASSDFISTDLIKYEFVSSNDNWEIQNNVLANKKALSTINEFVIKGTIYGASYVEFSFNVKFIKSVNTSSMFIPTGTSTEQQGASDRVNIQTTNYHNIINVVSGKETANFFNLTLPTRTKNNMFDKWLNPFPENSQIEYSPISATNDNPFSLTVDGVISNNAAINSPKTLLINGVIKSTTNPNNIVAINLELIIAPKVNVVATNKLITKVESSSSNQSSAVYQEGTASIQNSTITITPANVNDKYFKITLPKVTTDGMFTGLDDTSYPVGSRINYGPLYSTNPNLDFSNLGENPIIYNKPNKPLSSTNNKFNINVFIYDTAGQSIKIPFVIIFNI